MSLREALAGHGEAVSKVMGGAETAAESEYARQYGVTADQAKTRYATDVNTANINYQGGVHTADQIFASAMNTYNQMMANERATISATRGASAGYNVGSSGGGGGGGIGKVSWQGSSESADPWAPPTKDNPAGGRWYKPPSKDTGTNPDYPYYRHELNNS